MNIASLLNELENLKCQYAFYFRQNNQNSIFHANCDRFPSASLIKLPILLAWVHLERLGEVSHTETCNLNAVPQVEGAGLSWLLRSRSLPFRDILLMMIALSDNLCTNLVISRIGQERLNKIFHDKLGLAGAQLQRKMMDFEGRASGKDNWLTAQDCIHLYTLFQQLTLEEQNWVNPMLLANQDSSLLLRDLTRDTVSFYHKTGSIPHVLHDWGFTRDRELFLLTHNVQDEAAVCQVFGQAGRLLE